jgi:hypothetical protein
MLCEAPHPQGGESLLSEGQRPSNSLNNLFFWWATKGQRPFEFYGNCRAIHSCPAKLGIPVVIVNRTIIVEGTVCCREEFTTQQYSSGLYLLPGLMPYSLHQ